jgi:Ran GTPase-activating protein (RanGAP) involved in mRNA processing and transport
MEGFYVGSDEGAAFAAAFQANQTIKTLIMRRNFIEHHAAVLFVEALPHDHSLETIIFDSDSFDDDRVLSIIRTLCQKHLKNLSLVDCFVSQDGCERIIQFLKENEHSFIKLKLFPDYAVSPWQNKIRLEIEELTWNNYLQDEKDKWLDQFLGQDARTKELLFRALERAKKLDNERFSKAPNMLFHLVKQLPDSIVQAMHDGHKT